MGVPSPKWLRERTGWMVKFTVVPTFLRMGVLAAISLASKHLFGFALRSFLRLTTGFEEEKEEAEDRDAAPLMPGGWALLKYANHWATVERLQLKTIQDYRAAKLAASGADPLRMPLSAPSDAPSHIMLLPASLKHMSFEEYHLALGYPKWFAVLSACSHLLWWHLLQVLLFSLVFLCCCDLVDDVQLLCGGLFCFRQVVYLIGLVIASWRRPAYLLFHPMAAQRAGGNWYLEVGSYVLQPETWTMKVAFVDHAAKPVAYFAVLALTFLTDLSAVVAMVTGLMSGKLLLPLACCYAAGTLSAALTLFAFFLTDFFTECVEKSDIELVKRLRHASCPAQDLSAMGYSTNDLRKGGYSAKELTVAGCGDLPGAGFSYKDILDSARALGREGFPARSNFREAGYPTTFLKVGGYSAKELAAAGYTATDLREGGYCAKALSAAGYDAKELQTGGFCARELGALGYNVNELRAAGCSAEDLKAAGYSAKDLKAAGCSATDLRTEGCSARELLAAGYSYDDLWLAARFSHQDILSAASALRREGVPAIDFRVAGWYAYRLVRAGYSAEELRAAGCDRYEVLSAYRSASSRP